MEIDQTDINIEKYIQGELSGDVLKAFEARLEKDEALQKRVNIYQYTHSVLQSNSSLKKNSEVDAGLKASLNQLGKEYFSKETVQEFSPTPELMQEEATAKPPIVKRLLPLAALAAAAALLLFLFLPQKDNALYVNFFEPIEPMKVHSSVDDADLLGQGNKQYGTKNYKEAIELYENYLLENPVKHSPWALLYKGCAHMVLDQMDLAKQTFQQLAKHHIDFADRANWYLALCHLKKEEENQCKTILKRITTGDKVYFDKAQRLLKELR